MCSIVSLKSYFEGKYINDNEDLESNIKANFLNLIIEKFPEYSFNINHNDSENPWNWYFKGEKFSNPESEYKVSENILIATCKELINELKDKCEQNDKDAINTITSMQMLLLDL